MQFPTPQFAVFFLLSLTIAWALRRRTVLWKLFLLIASYSFYASWHWKLLSLIVFSSLVDYIAGEGITRAKRPGARKAWLGLSISVNVALLGFFKYYNFFRESFASLLEFAGLASPIPILEVLLPIGISFYTFQSMAYSIDLYRGHGWKAPTLLDFLLFVSFFPQLVIGPICRSSDLMPQLIAGPPEKVPEVNRAIGLIASGLFKKVVLSTLLATHLVDDAFIAPENYSSLELLVGLYGYTMQIYFDFSGYTDIAIGIALLLGIHLPENFNRPYAAANIGEFWRRWHMSFSYWLRDYIYFPLGGSRVPKLRIYFNILVTMLIGGLWHGAHWKFILWGAVHGAAMVIYKAWIDFRRSVLGKGKALPPPTGTGLVAGWLITFHLCVFARLFFRAADLQTVSAYAGRLLDFTIRGRGIEPIVIGIILLGLAMNFYGHHWRKTFERLHERIPWLLRPLVWGGIGVLLLLLKPGDVAPYIYFQF